MSVGVPTPALKSFLWTWFWFGVPDLCTSLAEILNPSPQFNDDGTVTSPQCAALMARAAAI